MEKGSRATLTRQRQSTRELELGAFKKPPSLGHYGNDSQLLSAANTSNKMDGLAFPKQSVPIDKVSAASPSS